MNKTCNLCKAKIELNKIQSDCILGYQVKLVEKGKKIDLIPLQECPKPLSNVKLEKLVEFKKKIKQEKKVNITSIQQAAKDILMYCDNHWCNTSCDLFDNVRRQCFTGTEIAPKEWYLEVIEKIRKIF